MLLNLSAILDDGSAQGLTVPRTAALALNLCHKESTTLRYTLTTRSGAPINLPPTDDTYLVLQVRKDQSSTSLLKLVATKQPTLGRGVADFTLGALSWARLQPRTYRYDVWLVRGELQDVVVPYSYFHVGPGLGVGPGLTESSLVNGPNFDFGEV